MKQQLLKPILMAAFVIFGFSNTFAQTFDFTNSIDNFIPVGAATTDITSGTTLLINAQDNRGNIYIEQETVANGGYAVVAANFNFLKVVVKNNTSLNRLSLRTTAGGTNATVGGFQTISTGDTGFQTYYFSLSGANWTGTVESWRVFLGFNNTGTGNAETLEFDSVEFLNLADTFAGHIQNPGFDDIFGDDGVWNPSDKPFSSTAVTTEEFKDGVQSLKMDFTGNQDVSGGGAGNVAVFSTYNGPVGPYVANADVTLRAKIWVKYKREASATNADKAITIQGNWKLFLDGAGLAGVKTNNQTLTLVHDVWTVFEFETIFADAAAFNQAQFRPIFNFANAMLTGEAIYYDAMDSCDGCATLGTSEFNAVEFNMYPNPVKNTLNIKSQDAISNVAVYDLLGKEVISSNNVSNTLDVSALSNGVYLIRLTSNKGVATKRFVKE